MLDPVIARRRRPYRSMQSAIERRPARDLGGPEDDHARQFQRRGEMRDAGVVAHQQPRAAQQRRKGAGGDRRRSVDRGSAHRGRHRSGDRGLVLRAGQHQRQAAVVVQGVANRGEALRRPAPLHCSCAGMQTNVRIRPQARGDAARGEFGMVGSGQRKLQLLADGRGAEKAHQREQTPDLRAVVGIRQERPVATARSAETGVEPCAELRDERVRDRAVAMHLDRQTGSPRPHRGKEPGQCGRIGRLFRKARKAGKSDEIVDMARVAGGKRRRPGQADERDARVRTGCTQCAQRRHGTQHVAQLQRPEHDDRLRLQNVQQEMLHADFLPKMGLRCCNRDAGPHWRHGRRLSGRARVTGAGRAGSPGASYKAV
ncbi:hypothetical protein ebA7016 [Aromatoleum aromaticum EbN1]|uniref:Uncharacterized protein n=1 Tax=Aromatoleum aromaticum (strain DSM 19018 / LMG 30748 / EbN1) TaxID=76114 RepID=Q5NXV3_AROAE|nr:hypothetical protein ebA7016 [Aromatoleum aromaticum EbN1]